MNLVQIVKNCLHTHTRTHVYFRLRVFGRSIGFTLLDYCLVLPVPISCVFMRVMRSRGVLWGSDQVQETS